MIWLGVALAGGVGALLRASVGEAALRRRPGTGPFLGTAAVNLVGALLLGIVVGLDDATLLAVVGTGLCGALTTFSTWVVRAAVRWRQRPLLVAVDLLGQLVVGVALGAVGVAIGHALR